MKKINLLIGAVAISFASIAQITSPVSSYSNRLIVKEKHTDIKKMRAVKNPLLRTSSVSGGWFNYGLALDGPALNAGIADLNSNYLFPDSAGYGEFGAGNFAGCWVHHLGDILDIKGLPFQIEPSTAFGSAGNPYVLDSMSIMYGYTRNHPNPAIVDTLIFTIFNNSTATNLSGYYFTGTTAANYGTDTLSFKAIKYTQASNSVNATGTYKFKVLLDGSDTANYFREKAVKLPAAFMVPSAKLLITDVQFKPGYTYTLGTHIDYDANAFFFTSLEEKGAGTFPTFYDCNSGSAACDWNVSAIVPQNVRYNTAGSWNGLFIPTYAYTAPYGFEHHLISYRLTETVGVKELENNDFILGQNMPNPFTSGSVVKFELTKSAKAVSFSITDVTGRVISNQTVANTVGIHSVNIGDLSAGVYYYSLNVDGNVVTKKMIAQ